ncbi:hypothetical protein [Quatrionicoccus australiensis]|uniref:hypothetical protein n=1 Tax=Quatrionicoccus australiensis TaxID=138118 RepID=UPI001CFA218E|nr:hypothetical protein [Quatrionicoccus australiensis]MCB4358676.1 hypothetical protein [Quatrionicoccus australiensis]
MSSRLSFPQKVLLGTLLAASLFASLAGIRAGWHDFLLMKPRAVVDSWRNGAPPGMKLWGLTLQQLKQAQVRNPDDPQVEESLGYLYALQAMRSREIPELKQALFSESIGHFRRSTNLRPMSPYAWSNLALALHENDEASEEMWAAFDRAMLYGQREIAVQKQLAEIAFARWNEVGETRQAQMREIVSKVGEEYREALLNIVERNNVEGLMAEPLPEAVGENVSAEPK